MKYLCYDSALNDAYTLIQLMQRYPKHTNLFAGTNDRGIWDAAPWLFELNNNPFELKGRPLIQMEHCVVFETEELLSNVLDYLHSKIYIYENEQEKYVRLWDARVLLKRLSLWPTRDIQDFFQMFPAIYTQQEDAGFLNKWIWKGGNKILPEQVATAVVLPLIKSEEDLETEYEAQQKARDASMQRREPPPPEDTPSKAPENLEEEKPKRRRFLMD